MTATSTTRCNHSGYTKSLWMEVELPSFPPLEKDLEVDVCIVGGGIAGLTCAYTLAKAGKSVVIVDRGVIAGGQTARTTGHLTWALDDRFFDLEMLFGEEGAHLAAESHSQAIDRIEQIILEEGIDCDFERVDGYLFVPPEDPPEVLEKEWNALVKLDRGVRKVERAPFAPFDTGPCILFPHQAQFHSLKYLRGLTEAILKYGGKLYNHTPITHFEEGTSCLSRSEQGVNITSQFLIVATATPVNNRFSIHTKQAAYLTYVIAAPIAKNSFPKGLYWDTADPYHYLRIQKDLNDPQIDWLLIGGEDRKVGQDEGIEIRFQRLEQWAKKRFPMINQIGYRWSGEIFEPIDSLGFIGRNPGDKHTYIATGDSGNGLTHGTIAGILIPDLISGKMSRWEKIYNPSRVTWSATLEFLKENFNGMVQYLDWLTPGERTTIESLPPSEGIIIREGAKKLAVYKDKENRIQIFSAFCPHLGGCLRWNSVEKSWDCPVHGSRFNSSGEVLNGPALCPMHRENRTE